MTDITPDLPRLEPPRIAQRTKLFPLAPRGLGTAACESLTSYLYRLALAHCLSTFDLAWYVISTALGDAAMPKDKETRQPWREHQLSGPGVVPMRWAQAIGSLNQRTDIERLTLVPWRDVLSPRLLIGTTDRWCPACFEQARSEGNDPHIQLLWEVQAVEACPHHRVTLVSQCPHCCLQRSRAKAASPVPGYCTACGSWLGAPAESLAPATEGQVRHAEQVSALIAASGTRAADASGTGLRQALKAGIDRFFSGHAAWLGNAVGQPKNSVHMWLAKGTLPALPSLLRIAEVLRIPLLDLVTGNVAALGTLPAVEDAERPAPVRVKRVAPRKLDWRAIEAKLRELQQHWPPLSTAAIAQEVGVDYRALHYHLAPLLTQTSRRYADYVSEQARARAGAKVALVRDAAFGLMAQGLEPTASRMRKALEGKLPFVGKTVWDAWRAARAESLPEGRHPAAARNPAQESGNSTEKTAISEGCTLCTLDAETPDLRA